MIWLAFLGFFSVSAQAQPDLILDRILFEPALLTDNQVESPVDNPVESPDKNQTINAGNTTSTDFSAHATDPVFVADSDSVASPDSYLRQITLREQQTSPFDSQLFEQYLGLGISYQSRGEHEAAITAFEKAEYISRINNGLYAPDQFPIIQRMIDSYEATGDLTSATRREQYLFYLNEQHYGENSLELVPILIAQADRNSNAFLNALHAGNYVGIVSAMEPEPATLHLAALPS